MEEELNGWHMDTDLQTGGGTAFLQEAEPKTPYWDMSVDYIVCCDS